MAMSLMDYVTVRSGSWASQAAQASGNVIELTQFDDAVVFQGPLSLNVAVVAEAVLMPVAGGNARSSVNDLFSYDVEVPAGYTWRYQMADSPAGQRVSGFKVVIRPAPCVRTPPVQAPDLPCDFAVCNLTNVGQFFPIGCEPCGTGPVRLPPTCGPSLAVMPASGGCVRPRFFNGMFITREDLETQLRYLRLKNQLQRRADGDGVVWGLGLGRDGSAVCVQPGYAVDCCGNDLTVTSVYKVDAATLLSDPAICNLMTGKQQCMSLLLEYIECPEQPRPVHGGDPCSGQSPGCEMSRVRETVRLRLVPPRDYQPSGPIQRFLDTISKGAPATQGGTQTAPAANTVTSPTTIPFQIAVTCPTAGARMVPSGGTATSVISLQPSTTATATQQFTLTGSSVLTITMPAPGQYVMSGGTVQTTSSSPAGAMTATSISLPSGGTNQAITWQLDAAQAFSGQHFAQAVYTVQNWTAPAGAEAPGGTYSGSTTITVAAYGVVGAAARVTYFQVSVAPSPITLSVPPPAPFPCLTDPCCGSTPLFPVAPPWADANPFKPGQAADLDVILLAVTYVMLAGAIAQNNANTATLRTLYEAVARLVDPNVTTLDALNQETQAVQQLLSDLCCALLYPGPSCHGEPHGVVIGCASISGGQIERVDPWGGRRWVMHYPLWSYWGAQFGLVPPDVLASRLFSFICCVAGLKAPSFASLKAEQSGAALSGQAVAVGAGQIVVNASAAAIGPAMETVSLPVFAARVVSALSRQPAPRGTPMIDVALAGNPAIRLQVPDTSASPVTSPAGVPTSPAALLAGLSAAAGTPQAGIAAALGTPQVGVAAALGTPQVGVAAALGTPQAGVAAALGTPQTGASAALGTPLAGAGPSATALAGHVQTAFTAPEVRTAVPPLLRSFAAALGSQLLNALPLAALDPPALVLAPLMVSGVTSVGALLARTPESLYQTVLGKTEAADLSNLVTAAETKPAEVAGAVAVALKAAAAHHALLTTDDLANADARSALTASLTASLHLPADAVAAAVTAALA
jgi:hypothetical protein